MDDVVATQPKLVTRADFEGCAFEAPIASLNHINTDAFSEAYQQAGAKSEPPCDGVFGLLAAICGIHLDLEARGSKWGPGMQFGTQRTLIPSDIRGEQSEVIAGLLDRTQHPALRARLADVVWSNDMRKGAAAKIAVDAYCDCIDGLVAGTLVSSVQADGLDLYQALRAGQRALQIASAISKKGAPPPERLTRALRSLYAETLAKGEHLAFGKTARLCVDHGLLEERQVAVDAEAIASGKPAANPLLAQSVWDYASALYEGLGDTAAQQRCALGAVRQLLRMRDECGQAGAKASWVMDALLRLRHIKGQEAQDLETELEQELRTLQRTSLREMGSFAINLDNAPLREHALEMFAPLDLSDTLKSFALLDTSPKIEDLKAAALEQGRASPLNSMMSAKHVDAEGKTIVVTDGSGDAEPPDDWYVRMIAHAEELRRASVVANAIEPVRLMITGKIMLEDRHFSAIAWLCPFIPEAHAPNYAAGFAKLFQGDFLAAAHLLIPQLEPSLRHILKASGEDPTKRRDDTTEEERSIDAIISNHRPVLEAIFGQPLLEELNRVFNIKPGPALRHDMAHGQLTAAQCYSADGIYGCWLLYRVCCLFLADRWDELVRPALASEEPGR